MRRLINIIESILGFVIFILLHIYNLIQKLLMILWRILRRSFRHGLIVTALLATIVITSAGIALLYDLPGSGFGQVIYSSGEIHHAKTLWDWLDLLIVPVILAIGGFIVNSTVQRAERVRVEKQAETDRQLADDRFKEEALQSYLDRMTELLLEKELSKTERSSEADTVARARTLTILRSVDGARKGLLINFLYEAGLIQDDPIIHLDAADLRFSILRDAMLNSINLEDAILSQSNFSYASLTRARLARAKFRQSRLDGVILTESDLTETDFSQSRLIGADLSGAIIEKTHFVKAVLEPIILETLPLSQQAIVQEVNFSNTHLKFGYFQSAKVSKANFAEASIVNSNFTSADLSGASFKNARIESTTFESAVLTDVDFIDCVLIDVSFLNSNVSINRLKYAKRADVLLPNGDEYSLPTST